ncbi:MAG TPA: tetratricopeptide repeat protein [Nitrospirota bacterium]
MTWLSMIAYYFLFSILFRYPYIFLAVVIAYILRDRIPNPADLFRRKKKIAQLNSMVSVNPYDSTARRDLGMLLLDAGRPGEARDNLIEAYRKDGGSAEINHLLGLAMLRTGQAEKAAGYLARAIEVEPRFRYGESYLYMGEAHLELGRPEDAVKTLNDFLAINNSSIEGKYFMAKALSLLGMKEEALKAAEEGIRFHRGNPSFRRRRDWRWNVKLKALRRRL